MSSKWLGFAFFCVCMSFAASSAIGDGCALTIRALSEYAKLGVRPTYLENALQQCPLPGVFRTHHEERAANPSPLCPICEVAADLLITQRKLGMTDEQINVEAVYICTTLKIENQRVCQSIIDLNLEIFLYIVDNDKDIRGSKFCSLLMRGFNCVSDDYEWTVDVPEGKTIDKTKANGTKTFNILHISDIHYDPLYTPGKTNKCGEPVCCQDDQPDGTDATDTCGYWSDYTDADVPFHTMQEALRQSSTHDFDYVYYTGDFVSHRVWSTSVQNNTRDIKAVTDQFRKYFDVPVYPVLGNHEPHPVNVWSSDGINDPILSTQWVFDLVSEEWGQWLTEDAKKTLLRGGYYTVSPTKGFRIIALNSNVCYIVNWWLINENEDPYDQLAWLAEVLLEAEKNQESVHIISHLPSGSVDCLSTWSREYRRLVKRFANTITAQFTGHTHRDELWVYYDSEDTKQPIGVSWNGASITPFSNSNPSYKVYRVDGEAFEILDFEEWTFNLTLANLDPEKDVEWYKLYSFKDAYGVDRLEPSDVDDLINRMTKDHSLIQKYYNFKFRNSDVAVKNACNESCEKELLCKMVTTVNGDDEHCERLTQMYDENK